MFQTGLFSLAMLTFVQSASVTKQEIPDVGVICQRNSPNLNKCLRDLLQAHIINSPEEGRLSLESIVVDDIKGDFKGAGYDFSHQIKNMSIKGLSKTKILAVRADLKDPKNIKIELDTTVPEVRMRGYYKIDGFFASIKVRGHGPFTTNSSDVSTTVKVSAHIVDKDGIKYMDVHKVDMEPKIGQAKFYFDNIIDGNPGASDTVNKFFNNLWKPAYQEMMPYMKQLFDKVSKRFVNLALSRIPYDIILPE